MSSYTELVLKFRINTKDEKVLEILNYLFNNKDEEPTDLPDHDFFKCERWRQIGRQSSFYHVPFALSFFDGDFIFTRCDLLNYDNEIQKFLFWILPYSDDPELIKTIGWIWLEECDEPFLINKEKVDLWKRSKGWSK